jgi:hypothetical protein
VKNANKIRVKPLRRLNGKSTEYSYALQLQMPILNQIPIKIANGIRANGL